MDAPITLVDEALTARQAGALFADLLFLGGGLALVVTAVVLARVAKRRRRQAIPSPSSTPVAEGVGLPPRAGPSVPAPPGAGPLPVSRPRPTGLPRIASAICALLGLLLLLGFVVSLMGGAAESVRTLTAPARAGGLTRVDDAKSQQLLSAKEAEMRAEGMDKPVLAAYAKEGESQPYLVFSGGEDKIADPDRTLRRAIEAAAQAGGASVTAERSYEAGPLGGKVRCARLISGEAAYVICGWADRSTLGIAMVLDGDPATLAPLLLQMRSDMEHEQQ